MEISREYTSRLAASPGLLRHAARAGCAAGTWVGNGH